MYHLCLPFYLSIEKIRKVNICNQTLIISLKADWRQEKEQMSNEMMTLTLQNKELVSKLNSTTMQRENERFDIVNLNRKLQTLQNEMEKVLENLEGLFDHLSNFCE